MVNLKLFSRTVSLPFLASYRCKVRFLPKEKYDDYETPFVKKEPSLIRWPTNILAFFHQKNLFEGWKDYRKREDDKEFRNDQKFVPKRHELLGPDLATTHFFTARGAKIRFSGTNDWVTYDHIKEGTIPSIYKAGYYVEEIDASGMSLCYEGFDNLFYLVQLKRLNLSNCLHIDDWCLSRSYIFENSLEYLNISGCKNVTERGICALHRLRCLKTLVIYDTPNIQNKELVCLMLQDVLPNCEIEGVNYEDPILLQRVKRFIE